MSNAIEILKEIYPTVQNGAQDKIKEAADHIKQLQADYEDLKSSIDLPEAPTSATVKVVEQDTGFEWLFTVRSIGAATRLLEGLPSIGLKLIENGFAPANNGYVVQSDSQSPTNQNELAFEASELVGSVTEGKTYWKVKGGKFSQYGVTVWPEVLTAAGFADDLSPMEKYSLAGYTAYYVLNDKGNPQKVTRLAAP